MTEPFYNHPGEVREAMNFRCLHCNKIFTSSQGLDAHLAQVHKTNLRNFQYKKDWDVTTEIAGNHLPIVGRKSTYKSGDRPMKSSAERKFNLKCLVEGCGAVYSSSAGMSQHQMKVHNQGSKRNVNWEWTTDPVTFKDKRAVAAQGRKGIGATATAGQSRIKTEVEGSLNFKCLICKRVIGSLSGMVSHLRRVHKQGPNKNVNWERTKEPITYPTESYKRGSYKRRQQVVPAPTPLILSPDSKYIEINAVIRVPIEIGQPEILQQS